MLLFSAKRNALLLSRVCRTGGQGSRPGFRNPRNPPKNPAKKPPQSSFVSRAVNN